jgi:hypothetical protein
MQGHCTWRRGEGDWCRIQGWQGPAPEGTLQDERGSCDGSAEKDFAVLTEACVGEDAMGTFLDPVNGMLATKDRGIPSEVGRQMTEQGDSGGRGRGR